MNALSIIKKVKVPAPVAKLALKGKKHAPEILVVTGAFLVVGSAVVACKNTLKAHDILEEANKDLSDIDKSVAASNQEDYTPKAARKDRSKVYIKTGAELAKCYGPAIVGGAVGFGMIFGAQKILKDRNAALTVAYTNLLNSFNSYRKRVADQIGEDKELYIRSGAEKADIQVEDEDGSTKKIKNAMVVHDDGSGHSPYAKIFDEYNKNWSKNPGSNLVFLRQQQQWANDALRAQGYLFLNDVYQQLGFPRTSDGQIMGWIYDKGNPDHIGDNYVDFGIYDCLYKDAAKRDFINAAEPCVWLDFNVDGVVYDLI